MALENENRYFNLASEVVNFTACNLFLTGKAGTGKTTFLKFIKEHTIKNTAVVAPTGVAAINAGGVTMHSFFQLPFVAFSPVDNALFNHTNSVDKHELLKNLRMSKPKLELIRSLELLVIDEVSMLRADMLDAMDVILRHTRNKSQKPFGGVQVLFIGDLFQLPPVVSDTEWQLLKQVYDTPFFFSAKVLQQYPPLFIELKKIYRQSELDFIKLLNNIRHNQLDQADWQLLKQLHRPISFDLSEKVITLTTHNHQADKINKQALDSLPGKVYTYEGFIDGDFSEKALPTEMVLSLKVGAQVMFVKNDMHPDKRYYNGKLATVKSLSKDEIVLTLADSLEEIEIGKEKWSNVRYVLNRESSKIEEEELGSFNQYPIRLAWAITIHKSQGLTFDKAIIDAGSSFAAGQVYVALSRCRTLEGLVLSTPITEQSILSDKRILDFSKQENTEAELLALLEVEKPKFAAQVLLNMFDWSYLFLEVQAFHELTLEKELPEKENIRNIAQNLLSHAKQQLEVADKFSTQLSQILASQPIDTQVLNERVRKAKQFFVNAIHQELLMPLEDIKAQLAGKSKVKQYLNSLKTFEAALWKKLELVQRVSFGEFSFDIPALVRKEVLHKKPKPSKVKGGTFIETFNLYHQGLNAEAIAQERGLAISTILGHLAEGVLSGEVKALDFIDENLLVQTEKLIETLGSDKLGDLKPHVAEEVSFTDLKFAVNHFRALKQKTSEG
jgi:hypothetical protein